MFFRLQFESLKVPGFGDGGTREKFGVLQMFFSQVISINKDT